MKTALTLIITLVTAAWGWDVLVTGTPSGGAPLWVLRQEALYLTGLLAIALMSVAMFLATRPTWLEAPLGGMDRVYRTHKWAGILACAFAAAHWLIEMSSDILKALVGREGRVPKENYGGFLEVLRDLAEDLGEWAIYALLAMLAITLWQRFPYRMWRFLHRAMPLLYLMLAFHALLLAPTDYWTQPVGTLLALLIAGGVHGSVLALAGRIGRSRQVCGSVVALDHPAGDLLAVRCRLDAGWPGHRPGQFAFVGFDDGEGQHPFTIASADRGDREITFQIKALGDYTRQLARRLAVGQPLRVEGPYGRFDIARQQRGAQQIWVAGGIGITPFLAWLEALQGRAADVPTADLHYCTRDRDGDPFVARLEALADRLPSIRLHVHDARQGQQLGADELAARHDRARPAEVWFCGPQGLADSLRDRLHELWQSRLRFHQEAFVMR
ncbi:ferric reductase-like transmembrane domain-containing protein [Accumulibacter sp.]|jgi:Predicted ferric reductase|uniref:ferredoxin reductase family protein n=1 Tax=Accumulibacter sp. TaxID=2053492 RepID=UPI0012C81C5B|nr:ferric reductase-like transmembrane domain-containing protein [Accumulibacter sp.]MQM33586.1 ferric reductase [Candidatus Accumulibacter phosphatis]